MEAKPQSFAFLCGGDGNKKNKNIFSKSVSFGKYLAH